MDETHVQDLVDGLRTAKKYRNLCDATLTRTAQWALARYPAPKLALKMAKNKLHQVYGAYWEGLDPAVIELALGAAGDRETIKGICLRVLASHASTRERLEVIDRMYSDIFGITGVSASLRDLACGLHPFAIPWMGLGSGTIYYASDIDLRLYRLHNRLLHAWGFDPVAECDDLLQPRERPAVDLTFLLKALPCLDQQEPGAAAKVLAGLNTRWLVVSFPTRSLGGRGKGMAAHYAATYEPLLCGVGSIVTELGYRNERVYLVRMAGT